MSAYSPITTTTMDLGILNQATIEDLQNIEGLGRKGAEMIVRYREKYGGFTSFDDLKRISGFGDRIVNLVRNQE